MKKLVETRPLLVAVVLAVVLGLPSLRTGLMLDDHAHLALLRGEWPGAWWDLFRFLPGNEDQTREWIARGPLPWWSDPSVKIAFFRPLSAALVRLDVAAFGDRYALFHVHSLLWTALWTASAWLVLRSSLPRGAAIVALLFFAVAPSHWAPVYWLASRNAIVASVLVFVALSAHVRWRAQGHAIGAWISPMAFLAALLAGETAIGGLGYFVAYEMFAAPREGRRTSLLGHLGVTALWLGLYRVMDAGTRATGFYADPIHEPLAFLRQAPLHAVTQLGTIVLLVPSHIGVFDPRAFAPQIVIGAFAFAAGWQLWRLAASALTEEERSGARWLGTGAAISVIPGLASSPGPRALAVGSLGFAVVVASWAIGARRRGKRAPFWFVVGLHGILPFVYWPGFALFSQRTLRAGRDAAVTLPLRGDGPLILVTASDPPSGLYLPFIRREASLPPLSRYWLLSLVPVAHEIARIDGATFELAPIGRRFTDTPFEKIFRRRGGPHVGETTRLDGASVTVAAESDGAPTRIRVRLDVPLESSNVIAWTNGRYVRLADLAVGEVRTLPR